MEVKTPWGTKIHIALTLVISLIALAALSGGAVLGYKMWQSQMEIKANQEMLLSNMRVTSELTVIREILEEKIGDRLTSDVKSKVAFTIQDNCRRRDIPVYIMLAIYDQESSWNPNSINSSSGASGLGNIMPDTAMTYFKLAGRTFSQEALMEPVTNAGMSVDILADKHETALVLGKTTKDNYTWALYFYSGRGDTYARDVIAKSVEYKKRLDTPVQEAIKKVQEQERQADVIKEAALIKGEKKVAKK